MEFIIRVPTITRRRRVVLSTANRSVQGAFRPPPSCPNGKNDRIFLVFPVPGPRRPRARTDPRGTDKYVRDADATETSRTCRKTRNRVAFAVGPNAAATGARKPFLPDVDVAISPSPPRALSSINAAGTLLGHYATPYAASRPLFFSLSLSPSPSSPLCPSALAAASDRPSSAPPLTLSVSVCLSLRLSPWRPRSFHDVQH